MWDKWLIYYSGLDLWQDVFLRECTHHTCIRRSLRHTVFKAAA